MACGFKSCTFHASSPTSPTATTATASPTASPTATAAASDDDDDDDDDRLRPPPSPRAPPATYVAEVEALVDSRQNVRLLMEAPKPLTDQELAKWYLTFSFHARICVDCGYRVVDSSPEGCCAKCMFQHMKMTYLKRERYCAFCQELCDSQLSCSHAVHHQCFRNFSASTLEDNDHSIDLLKCPICRIFLTESDLLHFVAATTDPDR